MEVLAMGYIGLEGRVCLRGTESMVHRLAGRQISHLLVDQ